MNRLVKRSLFILLTLPLAACATTQDKAFVDNLDCDAMQAMLRDSPTSPGTILDQWDNDRISGLDRTNEKNILAQSRPDLRDSYLRKTYKTRCK